jgi:glutaredoxin 3
MKITIYTTNTCAYCAMVKKYLDSKSLEYTIINLDQNPEKREEAYYYSKALTVPITMFEDHNSRKIVVGWQPDQLAKAIAWYNTRV